MGEFNKDANQGGPGKEEKGDKSAFGQFDKGQQSQEELGPEKGQDPGLGKEPFSQEKAQAEHSGQQFAQDKAQFGQGKDQFDQSKPEELGGTRGGQQQFENKGERQQGDEDLDEDSKSNIDNQGMK